MHVSSQLKINPDVNGAGFHLGMLFSRRSDFFCFVVVVVLLCYCFVAVVVVGCWGGGLVDYP